MSTPDESYTELFVSELADFGGKLSELRAIVDALEAKYGDVRIATNAGANSVIFFLTVPIQKARL